MSDRAYTTLRLLLFSLLIVWGGYTLLVYLGIPVHQAVLLGDAARQSVAEACPGQSAFCMGWNALFPFIGQTLRWASPFLWFALWSLLVYGILLVREFLRSGEWGLRITLRPATLVLTFIGFVWLFFTVIASSTTDGVPFGRLFEPTPQVYQGADPEQLAALQQSFNELKDGNCLTPVGAANNGANIYDVKALCMQGSFFTRVLPHAFFIVFLLLELLTLGRFLLRRLIGIRDIHPLAEATFSAGLGACGFIFVLWLTAVVGGLLGQPIYNTVFGWGLLFLVPALLWRDALYWLKSMWDRQWTHEGPWYSAAVFIGWVLISLLALNYLNVVRPFPIGWDDLGRYLNMPRLLVSYGFFIPQLASYQWEYMTSLGFLLFGYDSVFGATASMMINWMAGLLAVASVYTFGRLFLGAGRGVLAALLYYALPVVGHFSFADMKVDNAVFAVGVLAMLAAFLGLYPVAGEEADDNESPTLDWRWMILTGVLAGFAFALKPTAVMVFLGIGTIIFGAMVHWTAFLGTLSLSWALYTLEGRFNLSDIGTRVYGNPDAFSRPVMLGALLVLGGGLCAYSAFLKPTAFRRTAAGAGIIIAAFIATVIPWLAYNNIAYGNIVPSLVFTAPNTLSPSMEIGEGTEYPPADPAHLRTLPPDLQVDLSLCSNTSKTEELDRYWGYGSGWTHYLTLPWRLVMNIDSAGYYVTTYPALLLFPLLLLLPFFWRKEGKWLRWLTFGTAFILLQWIFFANGIPWYGLGMFFGFVIGLEALVARAPDIPSTVAVSILVTLSLFTAASNRFWQYDQQKNLFEYTLGKVSAEAMRERTIPYYDDIREMIDQLRATYPDRPYTYRMGTFIPYFIPKNLEVLPVGDHQLDLFSCLNQEKDAALTLRRLQTLGFNSMIFDTNTATIERDPNGSLHQKVNAFVDFVNTPGLGLQVPVNDPNAGIAFIVLPAPSAGSGTSLPPVQP